MEKREIAILLSFCEKKLKKNTATILKIPTWVYLIWIIAWRKLKLPSFYKIKWNVFIILSWILYACVVENFWQLSWHWCFLANSIFSATKNWWAFLLVRNATKAQLTVRIFDQKSRCERITNLIFCANGCNKVRKKKDKKLREL